jgi:putative transcriptional regulator
MRLNPTVYRNKRLVKRFVCHFLMAFLVLQATPFPVPHLAAESAGTKPSGPEFTAAIPQERPGGPGSREELAKGKFLVASRQLQDPNFRETVVLLIEYGLNGAMGVVINRPSAVKLATVFPDIKELKQRNDTVYIGGPVAVNQILMLIRSPKAPEDATVITSEVYISSSWEVLERMMKKKATKEESFRLFAGYAGWAPSQLDFERTREDWYVLKADAEMVFSQNPSQIWPELIRRATVKWVRVRIPQDSAYTNIRKNQNLIPWIGDFSRHARARRATRFLRKNISGFPLSRK